MTAKLAKAFVAALTASTVITAPKSTAPQSAAWPRAAFQAFVQSEAQRWLKVMVDGAITPD